MNTLVPFEPLFAHFPADVVKSTLERLFNALVSQYWEAKDEQYYSN